MTSHCDSHSDSFVVFYRCITSNWVDPRLEFSKGKKENGEVQLALYQQTAHASLCSQEREAAAILKVSAFRLCTLNPLSRIEVCTSSHLQLSWNAHALFSMPGRVWHGLRCVIFSSVGEKRLKQASQTCADPERLGHDLLWFFSLFWMRVSHVRGQQHNPARLFLPVQGRRFHMKPAIKSF